MKDTFICVMEETGKAINQGRAKTSPEEIFQYLKRFQLLLDKVGIESGSLYCSLLKKKLGLGDNKSKTKEFYETKKMGSQSQG